MTVLITPWIRTFIKILVLLLVPAPSLVHAGEDRDHHPDMRALELSLEAAFVAATYVDWQQTRYALSHADGGRELNPLLGSHPSERRLALSVVSVVGGHAIVSYLLPREYRWIWQYVTFAVEGGVVMRNSYRVGYRVGF